MGEIELRDNDKPVALSTPRHTKIPLKSAREVFQKMEQQGVIAKVSKPTK